MSDIMVLNEGNFSEVTGSGVVVVDFYADWCGPCRMMTPVLEEAQAEYAGRAVFAKVNVDDSKSIAINYKIMSIPTLLMFKDGQLSERFTGVTEKTALYEKINSLL